MEATITLGPGYALPEEEQIAATYQHLLRRLSHQSVVKHFDAYADIDWDAADYRIDPEDPRWELGSDDVLGATAWYRAQPQARRARLGLHLVATKMKIGTQFENVLQRGLLEFAWTLPNGSPEFRYVYHEVIEEGQHSLMFQEFVNRTGFDVAGLGFWDRFGARRVIAAARRFPALFFVFVLGGEDPIDHVQRTALRSAQPIHPLLRRIMQIHVTEEARHLCFARSYLRTEVPRLGAARRASLALQAPLVLGAMATAAVDLELERAEPGVLPPGPRVPALVQFLHLGFRPIAFLEECDRRYGTPFTLRVPARPPLVMFSDPEAIREIFTGDPELLRAGEANSLLEPMLGQHSLLLLDGPRHLRERRLMLPPFHGERMQAYGRVMREIADRSIDAWPVGRPFPIHDRMQAITLDVILRTVFGLDEGEALDHLRERLRRLMAFVSGTLGVLLLMPWIQRDLGPFTPGGRFVRLAREIDDLLFAETARRRADGVAGRGDILSMLTAV